MRPRQVRGFAPLSKVDRSVHPQLPVTENSRETGTVSKPYQNPISNNDWSYRSSEGQIPQIVESNKNRVEIWEPKDAYYSLDTQEVTDSSSVEPTTPQQLTAPLGQC